MVVYVFVAVCLKFDVDPVPPQADMRFYHSTSQPQYKTGGRYQGEWRENMKHGYGSRSWVNGNKYEGVS